jgi:hypothetical protein
MVREKTRPVVKKNTGGKLGRRIIREMNVWPGWKAGV